MDYLLDTNFIINYFKGIFKGDARKFTDDIINKPTFLSVITRIELLCWPSIPRRDESVINEFIFESVVLGLDENVIKRTILIRKANNIKLPDAIIAATALENNLQLIRHNIKDFKSVSNLIIINANEL